MAQGARTLFHEVSKTILKNVWDFQNDIWKLALIDNTKVAAATDIDPKLSDYTEVYGSLNPEGGGTLQNLTLVRTAGTTIFDASDFEVLTGPSEPTAVYQCIIYNATDPEQRCLCFIDATVDSGVTPWDLTSAHLAFAWGTNGIMKVAI